MKNTKFKVYDYDTKTMYNQDDLIITFDSAGEDVYVYKNDKVIPLYKYELLQYTGLKDKNGKEIYDRDILINTTAIGKDKIPRVVKYYGDSALYKVPFVREHWAWGYNDVNLGFLLEIHKNKYEVVGNFYKNEDDQNN